MKINKHYKNIERSFKYNLESQHGGLRAYTTTSNYLPIIFQLSSSSCIFSHKFINGKIQDGAYDLRLWA